MATSKVEIARYAGQEYFRAVEDPAKQGVKIESVASLCGVATDRVAAILRLCDAGKGWPELKPIFFGKWRLVEGMDIVDMDAIIHILRYFVVRTYNPVAYCELERHLCSRRGESQRKIESEELRLYKQACETRDAAERDD